MIQNNETHKKNQQKFFTKNINKNKTNKMIMKNQTQNNPEKTIPQKIFQLSTIRCTIIIHKNETYKNNSQIFHKNETNQNDPQK